MPDWKEMYLTLLRDTERAMRILEASQQKCAEMRGDVSSGGPTPGPIPALSGGRPDLTADAPGEDLPGRFPRVRPKRGRTQLKYSLTSAFSLYCLRTWSWMEPSSCSVSSRN